MNKLKGIIFCGIFALISYCICKLDFCKIINLNSLTLAIIIGVVVGNLFDKFIPENFKKGINFCAKKLLRLAIVLYGFRITFQQILL